jgi:hypothetical protein
MALDARERMTILDPTQLSCITGGQAATQTQDSSVEARAREMMREELDMREREDLRAFERQHPFTAMMCQGDRACLRDARR